MTVSGNRVQVAALDRGDGGVYTCTFKNIVGQVSHIIKLVIEGKTPDSELRSRAQAQLCGSRDTSDARNLRYSGGNQTRRERKAKEIWRQNVSAILQHRHRFMVSVKNGRPTSALPLRNLKQTKSWVCLHQGWLSFFMETSTRSQALFPLTVECHRFSSSLNLVSVVQPAPGTSPVVWFWLVSSMCFFVSVVFAAHLQESSRAALFELHCGKIQGQSESY